MRGNVGVMKMKRNIIIVLALFTVSVFAQENNKPIYPPEIAAVLKKELPAGWRCSSDHNCIVISRDEQVTLVSLVSLPPAEWKELIDRFGIKTDYIILLVFRPRLSDEQIEELKKLRDQSVERIRPSDDLKHGTTGLESRKYLLPNYQNSRFSIYLSRTDDQISKIFPESVEKERDVVLSVLSKIIEKREDPNKGKERIR